MAEKKDYIITYYRVNSRGPLHYVDILKVNRTKKTAEITNDALQTDDLILNKIKIPSFWFEHLLKRYSNKGYELIEVDGAQERLTPEECLSALKLSIPYEKLAIFADERVTPGYYYDYKLIKRVCDTYIDEGIDAHYITLWSVVYAKALFESYDIYTEEEKAFAFVVGTELWNFGLQVMSDESTKERKKTCDKLKNVLIKLDKKNRKEETENA